MTPLPLARRGLLRRGPIEGVCPPTCSADMERPSRNCQGSLLDGLTQGRVRVARPRHILGRRAEFHRGDQLRDQRAGIRADDVRTRAGDRGRLARRAVSQSRPSRPSHARAHSRWNGNFANVIGHPGSLQLLLGLTDRRNLRPRIDHARDRAIIPHALPAASEAFGQCHAFSSSALCASIGPAMASPIA